MIKFFRKFREQLLTKIISKDLIYDIEEIVLFIYQFGRNYFGWNCCIVGVDFRTFTLVNSISKSDCYILTALDFGLSTGEFDIMKQSQRSLFNK